MLIINFLTEAHQANNGRFIRGDVFFCSFSRVHCFSMLLVLDSSSSSSTIGSTGWKVKLFCFLFQIPKRMRRTRTHTHVCMLSTFILISISHIHIHIYRIWKQSIYLWYKRRILFMLIVFWKWHTFTHSTQQRYIDSFLSHSHSRVLTTHSVMQNHLKSDLASDVVHTHTLSHKLSEKEKCTNVWMRLFSSTHCFVRTHLFMHGYWS